MATKAKTNASKTVENVVEASKEKFEQAYKAGAETATQNVEKSVEMTKKQMDEMAKGFDEITAFSRQNVDALIASGNAAASGIEQLNSEFAAFSKKSIEEGVEAFKALSAAKSPREFFEIQNDLAKSSYDNFIAEAGKFSEISMKLFNDMFEPVSTRMATAMEQANRTAG